MKTIRLPCYGIVVEIVESDYPGQSELSRMLFGGGSIASNLKEKVSDSDSMEMEELDDIADFNNQMDAIEAMILGHAMAGVDIEDPAYIEGIETAVVACANHS